MKNLVVGFGFALFVAVGMSSCAVETCYSCEFSVGTLSTTADVCDGTVTTTAGGSSTTTDLGSQSTEDYKTSLEAAGYTCTAK